MKKKRSKQLKLIKPPRRNSKLWWIQTQSTFGGSMDYRKVQRPFDSKKLVHCVFKARVGQATYFTRSQKSIERVLKLSAHRYGVKLKSWAINKDHIHVLFYTKQREAMLRFLRFFSAEMGRKYAQVFRRLGLMPPNNLWQHRPFTRLVSWGKRSLENISNYLEQNRGEALGFLAYTPRKHRLNTFLKKWEMAFSTVRAGSNTS